MYVTRCELQQHLGPFVFTTFQGLEYIHKSSVHYHGNLKSTNCVVDSRWTCKLTDFGVPKIREQKRSSVTTEEKQWDSKSLTSIVHACC